MKTKINSTIIFLSIVIVFGLITITKPAVVAEEIISFENILAQQNSDDDDNNTELGGDTELGDTGMTESDLGEDIGTTVSDLENDTDIPNNNQTN
jgi:hypothetical protein